MEAKLDMDQARKGWLAYSPPDARMLLLDALDFFWAVLHSKVNPFADMFINLLVPGSKIHREGSSTTHSIQSIVRDVDRGIVAITKHRNQKDTTRHFLNESAHTVRMYQSDAYLDKLPLVCVAGSIDSFLDPVDLLFTPPEPGLSIPVRPLDPDIGTELSRALESDKQALDAFETGV